MNHPELPMNDDRLFLGALDRQVGGTHYKGRGIEPVVFFEKNKIPYCIANAIKYIYRYHQKNGRQDLEKALHYVEIAASFYRENGNPFPKNHIWGVEPDDFIFSNKMIGDEADIVRYLCWVQSHGLGGYMKAHNTVKKLLDTYETTKKGNHRDRS